MTLSTTGAIAPSNFLFNGSRPIRVIDIDGSPWFIAADVCAALELTNSRKSLQALDDDEKGVTLSYTPGGTQKLGIVSESGLYTLIMRCRGATTAGTLPHRFRKWVTSEVLPAIRTTGHYGRSSEMELIMTDTQGGERVNKRYYSVKGAGLRLDPMTGPTTLMHQRAMELLCAGSTLLELATNLLQDGAAPPAAVIRESRITEPAPTLDIDEQNYRRTIATIYEILANEQPPNACRGWTISGIEKAYGGIDKRLRVGQKALRLIIEQAIELGDLHYRPGPGRGNGYLTSTKPDASQKRPTTKRNGLVG